MGAIMHLSDMDAMLWLAAMVCFIVFEIITMGLYTIWFAGGSLIAFFAAMMGFNGWVQLGVFIIVSAILLIFTRPIAQKKLDKDKVKTNADSLIGEKARVIETIDNLAGTGRAVIHGQEWMARSTKDEVTFSVDDIVIVTELQGVKIIVKKEEE
ncbi:MAG: NfeD family protein [Lachnospiraceae bacterium]